MKSYTTITYGEFAATAQYLANAMKKHSLVSGKSKIAIYSSNCYEYDAIIIGGYYQNICNVSLYDTFGEEAVKYILEHVRNSTISDLHNKASHFGGNRTRPTLG